MKTLLDWKFVATLVAAVAGVVVPIWLWQADLGSKSMAITLTSRIPLQPKEQESLPGLEVSVEGVRIVDPHLVVFEITNDGSRPIPADDFASALEIRAQEGTSFIRSRITSRSPNDLEADLSTSKQSLSLSPTLFNPRDTLTITAIASGRSPVFSTKARVVGIPRIVLADGTKKESSTYRRAFLLISASLILVASMIAYQGATESNGVFLRQRAAAFVSLLTAFPGTLLFMMFLEEIGIESFWYFLLYLLIALVPISLVAAALNRKSNSDITKLMV